MSAISSPPDSGLPSYAAPVNTLLASANAAALAANAVNGQAIAPASAIIGNGTDGSNTSRVYGLTRAIRFGFSASGALLEGVDATGTASYEPLYIGGSVTYITASGAVIANVSGSGVSVNGALSAASVASAGAISGTTGAFSGVVTGNSLGVTPSISAISGGQTVIRLDSTFVNAAWRNWAFATSSAVGGDFTIFAGTTQGSNPLAGTAVISALSGGNVGIGTANPAHKLEVTGNIKGSGLIITGSCTVGTIPAPAAGGSIYVTNEVGGGVHASSNGTTWVRAGTQTVIS